jgi:2-C-methyl-D-erythritol 2,4-cyclodiphosphate synthase
VNQRIGFGYDAHRFGGEGPVILAGVSIDHPLGIDATSDGDLVAHAVCDAILGAGALGDIGMHFPSSDPQWRDVASLDLVSRCVTMAYNRGFELVNTDVTVIVEEVRIDPHREAMRTRLAEALRVAIGQVSIKATTTDRLGWIGAGDGLAAMAVVLMQR